MDLGSTILRPIAFVSAAILLAGATLSCRSESDPDPTSHVQATIDAAVEAATPTEAPKTEPTATVAATITASQPAPASEGSKGPVFRELDSASTGRDFAALLTSDETACLIGELEGTPSGERIFALLSGTDATREGLTVEESEAVRACDIETEFGFPKPEGAESQGLRPDGLSPVELGDPQQFFAELSARERTCLGDNGIGPGELGALSNPPSGGSPETTTSIVNCLQDDTVLRLFLTQLVGQVEPFEVETAACIREGFVPLDLRALLAPSVAGQAPANSLALSMAALGVSVTCLSDAEWEIYAPRLGMAPGDRAGFVCLLEALGGPAELVAAMQSASLGETPAKFIRASQVCGLEDSGPSDQEGAGQSGQGQRVLIDPGPGTTHIDPYLWGLLQRQAEGLPVPDRVTVSIGSY
ncbi:MAG: hypothetical protein OXN21_00890, partial [Chloroflexota bacterium]|nr:hypothetical protein [Chloroflexota bacterium]